VAERKKVDGDQVAKAASKLAVTRAGLATLNATLDDLKKKEEVALENYNAAPPPKAGMSADDQKKVSDVKAGLAGTWAAAKAALDAQKKLIKTAEKGVEEQTEQLAALVTSGKGAEPTYEETIQLELLPVAPDPDAVYLAKLDHGALRDDSVKFTVENGMLSSGTFTSTDQTPSVILKLAQSIAALGVGAPTGTQVLGRSKQQNKSLPSQQACEPYRVDRIFDPSNSKDIDAVKKELSGIADDGTSRNGKKSSYSLEVCSVGEQFSSNADIKNCAGKNYEPPSSKANPPSGPAYRGTTLSQKPADIHVGDDGFVYRIQRPYRIEVNPTSGNNSCAPANARSQTVVVNVPDSTMAFVLPMMAGSFTKNVVAANFKNGMPTDYSIDRPSEVNAIAGLPFDVAKAIVSVPAEIIQLKVNYNSQDAALVAAQAKVLDAQTALIASQKQLEAARANAAASDSQ